MTARLVTLFCALLLAAALTACRRGDTAGPTLQPTLSPTPRSTPLPTLPPTTAPGADANPIQFVIARPADASTSRADDAAGDLSAALSAAANLAVEVVLVDTPADALARLCAGTPTAAWLDALGYAAASALNCGTPALWAERGSGADATTSTAIQFIAAQTSEITAPAGLSGAAFCRLSLTDFATWRGPALMLQAAGIDPQALEEVRDLPDPESLIAAVADDDCAAALPAAVYDELATGAQRRAIRTVGTPVEFPDAVLFYPLEVPLGARLTLNEALIGLSGDRALDVLLGADAVLTLGDDDLNDFDAFLRRTGLDFAQLGN